MTRGNACGMCIAPSQFEQFFLNGKIKLPEMDVKFYLETITEAVQAIADIEK